jgi:hypothetical protein
MVEREREKMQQALGKWILSKKNKRLTLSARRILDSSNFTS